MVASDPTYPLFPVLSFLGFVLSVIPLRWHFQAWNSGTCAFMSWTGIVCLVTFINSIVWSDNAINVAPIWCDISSQIILAASLGIPASTLCISRRLYRITSTQTVSITRDDKIRAIYVDLAIAVGLPIFALLLHFIVQPHRFDIIEEYGCTSVTFNTLASYFLYYMWPVVIGLVSLVYSSLVLRTFYVRRIQFNQILSSNGVLNCSRYLRLMLLALIDIMCTVPISIYSIYVSLDGVALLPWISWDDTHFDFGQVVLIPAVLWRSDPKTYMSVQITRWLPVACAFIFFALFGFAEEATKNYRRAFWFVARPLGFRPASEKVSTGKGSVLSGLKKLVLDSNDKDSLPVYSAGIDIRKSVLNDESRSTICFPDDEIQLDAFQKSFSQTSVSSPPSSSTSTCYSHPLVIPAGAPPSYVDSAYLDTAALELSNPENNPFFRSSVGASFISLPDMIIEGLEQHSRPSSYSSPSMLSHQGGEEHEERDHISISDAYVDSQPASPVLSHFVARVPTPMPFSPPNILVPPQAAAVTSRRPFCAPSFFPVHPHTAQNTNGIVVMVHTQTSRDSF